MPNWTRHFDRIWCIHFVKNEARLPSAMAEFERVGIAQSGIFDLAFTYPDPWEARLLDAYPKIAGARDRASSVGFLNLGLESCRLMREAAAKGYRRVLFLEDDIRFLKDLDALAAGLDAMPSLDEWDIVQFDKFVDWNLTPEAYAQTEETNTIPGSPLYFDAKGVMYASGGCFAASARGMANMLKAMDEWRPGPMDGYLNVNGNRHAVAKRNLAVQVLVGDALVMKYMGRRNTHHLAYRPQGLRYEEYAVPEGYGYESLTAAV